MTLRSQILRRRALLASLLLAACGQQSPAQTSQSSVSSPAEGATAALAPSPRADLPPETTLAFVHTANVMGELEPCG